MKDLLESLGISNYKIGGFNSVLYDCLIFPTQFSLSGTARALRAFKNRREYCLWRHKNVPKRRIRLRNGKILKPRKGALYRVSH